MSSWDSRAVARSIWRYAALSPAGSSSCRPWKQRVGGEGAPPERSCGSREGEHLSLPEDGCTGWTELGGAEGSAECVGGKVVGAEPFFGDEAGLVLR